jgi:hypothetical protein
MLLPSPHDTSIARHTVPMPDVFHDTTAFRGARFTHSDLSDVVIRDCDVSRLRIVDSVADVLDVSGDLGRIVVNDVDVTDHVEAELNRRFPERARVAALATVDDYRDLWRTVEELWAQTLARFDRLPAGARDERVDGEWSLVETLRHLVAATDGWIGRAVLDRDQPFHRLGLMFDGFPPELAASIGIERGATARYEEILPVRAERTALVGEVLAGLDDAGLARVVSQSPTPAHPQKKRTVGECLKVVVQEEIEHRRYMERDLAVLEARLDS